MDTKNELEEALVNDSSEPEITPEMEKKAQEVVDNIQKAYLQAKSIAEDIAKKTISTWFYEKDLARQLRVDAKGLQQTLMHIDKFGFLEHKVVGAVYQLRITRDAEKVVKKLMTDRSMLVDKLTQLEALMTIAAEDLTKKDESLGQEVKVNEKNDTNEKVE